MKTTKLTALGIAVIGLGLAAAGLAQDKQPVLKTVSCPPECGFMVRSHDENEIVSLVKAHAKQMHGKELTDAQVKEMMKTVKQKSK